MSAATVDDVPNPSSMSNLALSTPSIPVVDETTVNLSPPRADSVSTSLAELASTYTLRRSGSMLEIRARSTQASAPTETAITLQLQEREYHKLLEEDPEMYSCFRECNPTYQLILSTLCKQSRTADQFFLSRWMMWRLYAWGLDKQIQVLFGKVKSGRDVFKLSETVSKDKGVDTIKVKTYGGQFYQKLPKDVESMEKIWRGGVNLWCSWKDHLPLSFEKAEKGIASAHLPMYKTGHLSRILLYGDLVRMGIVTSPSVGELARLLVCAKSGALKGLEIMGCEGKVDEVEVAVSSICDVLNSQLSPSTKALFHEGQGVLSWRQFLRKHLRYCG